MNKRLWIVAAVVLMAVGTSFAEDAPATNEAMELEVSSTCESTPIDFDAMTAAEIERFEQDNGLILTRTGGHSLPRCGAENRRCANAQGGCTPSGPCSSSDTGLTACEADDGWTIQCKYGQTVHIRTCVCEGFMVPCYGTDLRLVCQ